MADLISKTFPSLYEQSAGTVEVWVSFRDINDAECGIYGENNGGGVVLALKITPQNQFCFQIVGQSGWEFVIGTSIPSPDTWYYVVGTWNDASRLLSIYVNGILESTLTTWDVTFPDTIVRTALGYFTNGGGSHYWDGSIDEVRVSNTDRSAGWIQTAYTNECSPSTFYRLSSLARRE